MCFTDLFVSRCHFADCGLLRLSSYCLFLVNRSLCERTKVPVSMQRIPVVGPLHIISIKHSRVFIFEVFLLVSCCKDLCDKWKNVKSTISGDVFTLASVMNVSRMHNFSRFTADNVDNVSTYWEITRSRAALAFVLRLRACEKDHNGNNIIMLCCHGSKIIMLFVSSPVVIIFITLVVVWKCTALVLALVAVAFSSCCIPGGDVFLIFLPFPSLIISLLVSLLRDGCSVS